MNYNSGLSETCKEMLCGVLDSDRLRDSCAGIKCEGEKKLNA